MKNLRPLVEVLFILSVVSNYKVAAVPKGEVKLGITADVLTLLTGSFNDIPITYLDDIGDELNELVAMTRSQLNCGRYTIEDSTKTTIKDLTNLATCLIGFTKDSAKELPVSVNSVLQTITGLLDQSLLVVRFVGTSLIKDHKEKCAELIPKIEKFVASVDDCEDAISKSCLENALADEEMKTAIYCVL